MLSRLKTSIVSVYLNSVQKGSIPDQINSLAGLPGRKNIWSGSMLCFKFRQAGVGGKLIAALTILYCLVSIQTSQATWTPLSSGTTSEIWGIDFINANTGLFVTGGGTIKKTTDGGNSWFNTGTPGFQTLRGIIMWGNGNVQGVAAGHSGAWRTINEGANWSNTFATGSYYGMDILWSNQNVYCVGQSMTYAKTANWGAAWTTGTYSVSGTAGFDIYSIDITNVNTIYICGSSVNNAGVNTPKICRSTDGGATFSILVNFSPGVFTGAALNDIEFYYPGTTGYACGSNGRILRTTNSGSSWDTSYVGNFDLRQITFKSVDTAFVCSNSGKVFYTDNKGVNWKAYSYTGTSNNLRCIDYAGGYIWSGGSSGTLIKNFATVNEVTVSGAVSGNGAYENLASAFSAINSFSQTGANILVTINANTTEPFSGAVLNNGNWSGLVIQPAAGSAKNVSGAVTSGLPLIDFNGADNVKIDGFNSGGSSLSFLNSTVSSASGTSTIRFQNDAVNNTITNCNLYGSAQTTFGSASATVIFGGNSTVTGNDNNVISNCNIGPAGGNLPTCAVYFSGTTSSSSLYNNNDTVRNCNIYDYFFSSGHTVGIMVSSGNTATSVLNNKFYQSASRINTSSNLDHYAIYINNTSGDNFRISGNTIGYNSSAGTGLYTIHSVSQSNLYGISINAGTSQQTLIRNNIIAGIQLNGNWNSTNLINIIEGNVSVDSNTIGNLTGNSITFNSLNSFTTQQVYGIKLSGNGNKTATGNNIGGITVNAPVCYFYGIGFSTGGSPLWNCYNNIVGGSVSNSLQCLVTGSNVAYGISAEAGNSAAVFQSGNNIVRNINSQVTGTSFNQGTAGIYVSMPYGTFSITNNEIHSLVNSNSSQQTKLSGIAIYNGTGNADGNLIHSFRTGNVSSAIYGINSFSSVCNFTNNMVSLGKYGNDSSETNGCSIYGIYEWNPGNNFYFNSIYIGGYPVTGTANTFAFISPGTSVARKFYNNIFCNSRSNNGSAGKHYAIQVGGTSPNPSGLLCNYNDLYVSGTGGVMGYFNNADVLNLTNWKTLTGKDSNSVSANPEFISLNNLHIDSTKESSLNSAGITIAGFYNDYDNIPRNISTPDIGADEFNLSIKAEALNFDGTNDYVSLPNSLTQNLTAPTVSEITIEYWFKGSRIQSAVRFQTGSSWIVPGWGNPGNEKHLISTEGGTNGISVGAGVSDGNWHHVAMTWKKNTVNGFKSYLDGNLVEQRNSSNTDLPNMNVQGYLGRYNGTGEWTNGSLDEVRIWTKALSQVEIAANRFHELDSVPGLLASYHFNQGIVQGNNSGVTSLSDFTGNYNGTLTNFALTGNASNWVKPGPGFCSQNIEINIKGNNNTISDGDNTPSVSDNTDFGTISADTTSIKTFTIQNTGSDSLSIGAPFFTGTDSNRFSASTFTPSGKIPPGGSSTFTITFSQTGTGVKNAVVHIPNNDCDEYDYDFAITGTGLTASAKVLNFDGFDDYVALPDTLTHNLTAPSVSEITIEYWFKGSRIQSAVRFQTGSDYIVAGWGNPGSEKHVISTEDGTNGISVGPGVSDGNWHHVAMTWKKNTVNGFKSYLDGNLIEQRNSSNTDLPNMNVQGYLGRYNGTREWTNGSLDEVRIWARELSQTEISSNRFLEISNGPGLLASYHFNQGLSGDNNSGITALTEATNNYTGTLNNFTLNGGSSNWVSPGPYLTPAATTVSILVIPEGYYNPSTDELNMSDTVRVYLHSGISPFSKVDSAIGIINPVTHSGTFTFNNVSNGNYYIRLVHRNCIETWSAVPQALSNYDLTSSASQAYGNNLKQVDNSPIRFAIFSGDVNQDGTIDASDLSETDNDAFSSLSGYVRTDVTGDNYVDAGDVSIVDNNAYNSVSAVVP